MVQVIDMGGFKNEKIIVKFGGDEYEIFLEPQVEVYRQFMDVQGLKLDVEENWDRLKDWIANLIWATNKDLNRKAFKKSLTKFAVVNFLNSYNKILIGAGVLKNLKSLRKKGARKAKKK